VERSGSAESIYAVYHFVVAVNRALPDAPFGGDPSPTKTRQKALSVSGLPRGDKAPLTMTTKTTAKLKTTTAFSETATPHPALSRKGRGNGNGNGKNPKLAKQVLPLL
jgi:hypothetical protein